MSTAVHAPPGHPHRLALTGEPAALGASSRPRLRLAALRAPLVVKLVGASVLSLCLLAAVLRLALSSGVAATLGATATVVLAVVALSMVHLTLVIIALRPLRDLEDVAGRVWRGDYATRVEASSVADRSVLRVGSMFNLLLDSLAADRARMRALASEVIEIGDRERAALAAELHDSTAQRLAALLLQISLAARDCPDPIVAARLAEARNAAEEIVEEVRTLAQTVHPRVLDDLGLVAALQKLARESSRGTGIDVDVDVPNAGAVLALPKGTTSVLYRVSQEAVRNAIRHAKSRRVGIKLWIDARGTEVVLEVHDDGQGFDLQDAEQRRPGMGLFTMKERVTLVDGRFDVRTARSNGTTVVASIPLAPAAAESIGATNVR